jgi:hypothetical protein
MVVSNSRAPEASAAALRPLGVPRPVDVHADEEDAPIEVAVQRRGRRPEWRRVEQVDDAWRVAEEWWRDEPQERTYVRVRLEGGRPLTLFHDGLTGRWFEQPYALGSGASGTARSSQRMRT